MKTNWAGIGPVCVAVTALSMIMAALGCSEERKAKAAQLEREILGRGDSVQVEAPDEEGAALASGSADSLDSLSETPGAPPSDLIETRDAPDGQQSDTVEFSPLQTAVVEPPTQTEAEIPSVAGQGAPDTTSGTSNRQDPAAGRIGYAIQLLSTPSRAYADSQVTYFSGQGYLAYSIEAEVEGRTVYRVRVSAGESFRAADSLRQEIQDKYTLPGFVTKVTH